MRFVQATAAAPVVEMNTTPLIDVLLVLLVMLIITIPPQSHAVKFELPRSAPPARIDPRTNLLTIGADGTVRWNGVVLDRGQLRQELAASRQMRPSPELHVQPAPDARHGDVDEVLVAIKREQISRFGFVGNEQYRSVF
ncbi:MAG TPA: biopolymer transporter ExbD [Sphingomicrobium sp.]